MSKAMLISEVVNRRRIVGHFTLAPLLIDLGLWRGLDSS